MVTIFDNKTWYAYRHRGFSPGCQPDGWVALVHDHGRFGAIAYLEPLTEQQREEYELDEIEIGGNKMDNKKFTEKIGEFFGYYEDGHTIELEVWTDGGVNMNVVIEKDSEEGYFHQFEEYVKHFDIDEEIEAHRQDRRYKNDFTIRESLEDFEAYHEWIVKVLASIK